MTDPEHKPHVHRTDVQCGPDCSCRGYGTLPGDCPDCVTREAERAADKERIQVLERHIEQQAFDEPDYCACGYGAAVSYPPGFKPEHTDACPVPDILARAALQEKLGGHDVWCEEHGKYGDCRVHDSEQEGK